MAAIIVAIGALAALALFDLLAVRYGVDSQGPLAPLIGRRSCRSTAALQPWVQSVGCES